MKTKRIIFTITIALGFTSSILAQQSSKLWQWNQNPYSVSPAFIGVNEGVDVSAYYTNHFSKVPNSARNMGVMASGKLPNQNAGIGLNLSREIIGFENVFNGVLSYNYGVRINKELELKMGLSLGLIHQNFNTNGMYYHDLDESTIAAINNNPERSAFDASIGLAIVNKKYYLGLSTNRFLKNELEYNANNETYGFLYQQRINAIAGYTFSNIASDVDLRTSAFFEYQKNSPAFAMGNIEGVYKNSLWLGVGYGSGDLFAANAGLKLNKTIKMNYTYLIGSLSDQYKLGGGHEIMLTATLGNNTPKNTEKIKIITETVRDTIYIQKTDTIFKEVGSKATKKEPNAKKPSTAPKVVEMKTKQDLKIDEENNIIVDRLIPLNNEKIDTTKIKFKDVTFDDHVAGYYVIIGSFDIQSNADNFLKTSIIQGKQSYKIFDKSNNRYYIYIYYSTKESTAKQVQAENPQYEGIWVKPIE